ncbi:Phasin family protein [Hyphomicrobium sp. 1Nfss2.1]|uniref:hypothetical protein n=1 Tax=Hyphomicrobium sp. 1Nfss2.1 TaxID=3413936 RepID=UPI003C7D3A20
MAKEQIATKADQQLVAWTGPALATGVQLTDAMCTRAIEVTSELTDFTLARIEEDVRLPERLSHCRSPQDVQQTWIDFWNRAFIQYQGEWLRLAAINSGTLLAEPSAQQPNRARSAA